MSEKAQNQASGKFLFDKHIFDDDYVVTRESEPEPPPIFSLEELENAKREAYEKGRATAMREANASRDEHVAALIGKISADVHALFAAEHMRETAYEQESLRLAIAMLKKLFPAFEKRFGLDELKHVLVQTLEKSRGAVEIVVEASPANIEALQERVAQIGEMAAGREFRLRMLPNEAMSKDSCKIFWSDGGVIRDSEQLAAQIANIMEETLAAKTGSGHSS